MTSLRRFSLSEAENKLPFVNTFHIYVVQSFRRSYFMVKKPDGQYLYWGRETVLNLWYNPTVCHFKILWHSPMAYTFHHSSANINASRVKKIGHLEIFFKSMHPPSKIKMTLTKLFAYSFGTMNWCFTVSNHIRHTWNLSIKLCLNKRPFWKSP